MPDPVFFKTPAQLRRWLARNHGRSAELWIGMYKKASGKGGVTYREALDEALCYGWIDGVRKRLDELAFIQRFTPRRAKSYWSAVNIRRANELIAEGRMAAPGLDAFKRRDEAAAARYSFERQHATLDAASERKFRANKTAWTNFQSEAAWYRRVMLHWVTSAKKEETRQRRLATLIEKSIVKR